MTVGEATEIAVPELAAAQQPHWDEGVREALFEAVFANPGVETIGVLVGFPSITSAPARISAMIPAASADPPARAQLDHAAWASIHAAMASYYPGLGIVGWWLSRPGPGTDLLEIELEGARRLFGMTGQLGYVFDTSHRRAALYRLDNQRYIKIHEGPIERTLTRTRPVGSALPPALVALAFGVSIGVAGWLAAGLPGG